MARHIIYKYPLQASLNTVPQGDVIYVGNQNGQLTAWIQHDMEDASETEIILEVVGTGQGFDPARRTHRGTVLIGDMVWHVYERDSL